MLAINRSALTIKPKQPFVDWINRIGEGDTYTIKQLSKDNVVILLPEFSDHRQATEYVKSICKELFEHQLSGWCTDENLFPKKTDWQTFMKWFELAMNSEVFDMMDEEIIKEEALE